MPVEVRVRPEDAHDRGWAIADAKAVAIAQHDLKLAREARDNTIREALVNGVTVAELAQLTGLTRARISQIRHAQR